MRIIIYLVLLFAALSEIIAGQLADKTISSLLDSAETAFNMMDTMAIHYSTKALALSEKENNRDGRAASLLVLGKSAKIFGLYLKSVEYLNISLQIFEQLENKTKIAETLVNLGESYRAATNRDQLLFTPKVEKKWIAKQYFVLSIGNEGAISFKRNGVTLPPFGTKGSVIRNVKITYDKVDVSSAPWSTPKDSAVTVRRPRKKEPPPKQPQIRLMETAPIEKSSGKLKK